jgi:hypothetical protein
MCFIYGRLHLGNVAGDEACKGFYFDQNCWNKELDFGAAGIMVY